MRYLIILFCFTVLFSCENKTDLEGDFSSCIEGYYIELNIRGDSLRISSQKNRINRWTKFKRNADTIHFISAGEWIDSVHATFEFQNNENLVVYNYESNFTTDFNRIKENVNYDDDSKHKQGVLKRFKESKCYGDVIEFEKKYENLGE